LEFEGGILKTFFALLLLVCAPIGADPSPYPQKLSEWNLFQFQNGRFHLQDGVLSFDLNTPLFSDYALKFRTLTLPKESHVTYRENGVLDFPVGTYFSKTFYYRTAAGYRLIETRILIREPTGWIALPYIWNESQTDAMLQTGGAMIPIEFVRNDGSVQQANYKVPQQWECAYCHKQYPASGKIMTPLGPDAKNLNRENQLEHWSRIGILSGLPPSDQIPKLTRWDDPQADVTSRARAYLEVNCSHCHNSEGRASSTGLFLKSTETRPWNLGLCKTFRAGGSNLTYEIVPGKPDESFLHFRLSSTKPGVRMPEIGRTLVHEEGVALIRAWIESMEGTCPPRDRN
jgi:uncharacterized repeat protein (TIGR03806 family)